jgi:D-psicose/D-tagatose/L-ribulose 3-epimerase
MSYPFKHSICNEVFHPPGVKSEYTFASACKKIREIGYAGIEIAPFTLSDTPTELSLEQRAQYRSIMQSEGLHFVGLHWLMLMPKGLHCTTPDAQLRQRSWDHVRGLVDLCADLGRSASGHNGVLVFGSPHQRSTTGGSSIEEATQRFRDGFAQLAQHAMERHVTLLVEALPRAQSDIVNTVAEAVEIVRYCNSPAVQTMFDTHNAADEKIEHVAVVDRYFGWIRHVHVNEMDGKHCGRGDYPFRPLLQKLAERQYQRWVSLEAFDFSFGAETIARESLRHLMNQTI